MKQRISVRAIVRDGDKVLLMKRATGRPTILGKFEFPGGRIGYDEQPEDSLRRYLHDDAGIHIHTLQLYDAVTYIDRDDSSIQYIIIVYQVSPERVNHGVRLSQNYSKYEWSSLNNLQQNECTDLTQLMIGILQHDKKTDENKIMHQRNDDKIASKYDAIIYSDGGSRGNPGPSAAGFVILDENQSIIEQGGEYIGVTTNGIAEYYGVRLALERALELGFKRIDFRVDSMMIVGQVNGTILVKNRELWPLFERIHNLILKFERVKFSHVKREFNKLADGMVNKVLDKHTSHRNDIL